MRTSLSDQFHSWFHKNCFFFFLNEFCWKGETCRHKWCFRVSGATSWRLSPFELQPAVCSKTLFAIIVLQAISTCDHFYKLEKQIKFLALHDYFFEIYLTSMAKMCFRPVPLFKLCVTISYVLVSRESLQEQRDFLALSVVFLFVGAIGTKKSFTSTDIKNMKLFRRKLLDRCLKFNRMHITLPRKTWSTFTWNEKERISGKWSR